LEKGKGLGHGPESQPTNVLLAHLKKVRTKEFKEKTSASFFFSLQTLRSFQ